MKDKVRWKGKQNHLQLQIKAELHSIMYFSGGQDTLEYKHFLNGKEITQLMYIKCFKNLKSNGLGK